MMLGIATLIKTKIQTDWTETNPPIADLKYSFDEFDPNQMTPQILFENGPAKQTWIVKDVYRIEHELKITIHVRPTNYLPTTIANLRTTFLNFKTEIDRILRLARYTISGVTVTELSGWKDEPIEIGFDQTQKPREPIIWKSVQTVKTIYYIGVCG